MDEWLEDLQRRDGHIIDLTVSKAELSPSMRQREAEELIADVKLLAVAPPPPHLEDEEEEEELPSPKHSGSP